MNIDLNAKLHRGTVRECICGAHIQVGDGGKLKQNSAISLLLVLACVSERTVVLDVSRGRIDSATTDDTSAKTSSDEECERNIGKSS